MPEAKSIESTAVATRPDISPQVMLQLKEHLPNGLVITDLVGWHTPPGQAIWVNKDGEATESLEGTLITSQQVRAWWEKPLGSGNVAPDCRSFDAITGVGRYGARSKENPTGKCAECPMSAFGSASNGGQGQACRLHLLVYLLRGASVIPEVVWLPPTSVPTWRRGVVDAAGRGINLVGASVELGLVLEERRGLKFGRLIISKAEEGSEKDRQDARAIHGHVKPTEDATLFPALAADRQPAAGTSEEEVW